jgi:hypothetical protein
VHGFAGRTALAGRGRVDPRLSKSLWYLPVFPEYACVVLFTVVSSVVCLLVTFWRQHTTPTRPSSPEPVFTSLELLRGPGKRTLCYIFDTLHLLTIFLPALLCRAMPLYRSVRVFSPLYRLGHAMALRHKLASFGCRHPCDCIIGQDPVRQGVYPTASVDLLRRPVWKMPADIELYALTDQKVLGTSAQRHSCSMVRHIRRETCKC